MFGSDGDTHAFPPRCQRNDASEKGRTVKVERSVLLGAADSLCAAFTQVLLQQ